MLFQGVFRVYENDAPTYMNHKNSAPRSFDNVRVFSVFDNSVPAKDAVIRNLEYFNNP